MTIRAGQIVWYEVDPLNPGRRPTAAEVLRLEQERDAALGRVLCDKDPGHKYVESRVVERPALSAAKEVDHDL